MKKYSKYALSVYFYGESRLLPAKNPYRRKSRAIVRGENCRANYGILLDVVWVEGWDLY